MPPPAPALPPAALAFIPPLHNLAASQSTPSNAAPSTRTFCRPPPRHALLVPPTTLHPARTRAHPSTGPRRRAPLAVAAPSLPTTPSALPTPPAPRPSAGHRHTAESKRKISAANRGNVPWNKGRPHTEETKRKIAEATRRAMLQPEMRSHLRQRARGRKHTEATKLKIRETARQARQARGARAAELSAAGVAAARVRKPKKRPVPFEFAPETIAALNERVHGVLEDNFRKANDGSAKLISREKRPMSDETKEKLSRRIKEMWADPDYRSRVAEGVEERARRLRRSSSIGTSSSTKTELEVVDRPPKAPKSPKRRARVKKNLMLEPVEEEVPVEPAAEVFLDENSLEGITKEDLGLVGTHGPGLILASDSEEWSNAQGFDGQVGGAVSRKDTVSEALSASNGVPFDAGDVPGPSSTHAKVDTPDTAQQDHEELLESLASAGQLPSLDNESFIDLSEQQHSFGDDALGDHALTHDLRGLKGDPLDLAPPSSRLQLDSVEGGEDNSSLGFFDGPVDLVPPSDVDIGSAFVTLPLTEDEDKLSPTVPVGDMDFNSFRR